MKAWTFVLRTCPVNLAGPNRGGYQLSLLGEGICRASSSTVRTTRLSDHPGALRRLSFRDKSSTGHSYRSLYALCSSAIDCERSCLACAIQGACFWCLPRGDYLP